VSKIFERVWLEPNPESTRRTRPWGRDARSREFAQALSAPITYVLYRPGRSCQFRRSKTAVEWPGPYIKFCKVKQKAGPNIPLSNEILNLNRIQIRHQRTLCFSCHAIWTGPVLVVPLFRTCDPTAILTGRVQYKLPIL
jgi:hypothetical protein